MPDSEVSTIRDLIQYQYATIIAKSAFAASDRVQGFYAFNSLKHRATRSSMTPSRCFRVAFQWPHLLVDREMTETKNRKGVPKVAHKKLYDSIPPLRSGTPDNGDFGRERGDSGAEHKRCYSVRGR